MYKLHCDLCDREVPSSANMTAITWEDNQGYDSYFGHVFRKPRKMKCHICDDCLKLLKEKGRMNDR